MARANNELGSVRFSRRESAWLVTALLLSLLAHFGAWGGYEAGKKMGWWQKIHPPAWLHHAAAKPERLLQPLPPTNSEPNIFVDVTHADVDAPKQTKFYSNKNSRAANADTSDANVPQVSGTQKDMAKTEDVPRVPPPPKDAPKEAPKEAPKTENEPQLAKLQPSLPPQTQPELAKTEETPQKPGDLDPKPKTNSPAQLSTPKPPSERPRTLKQAQAQQDQLPGPAMHQAGGVAKHALWSSLDAKAVPFGDYDYAIIQAVSQRWYDMLDSRRFAQDRAGKVILRFKMKPDGSIIEMQTLENTVGELLGYLCQEAIEEAAPFAKWPDDMQRMIGTNYREITFTFYYY